MTGAGRMFRLHCSPDLPEPPGAACLQRLEAVARRTLSCHSAGGSVEAILTDDDEVRRLNRTFRGRDRATDVLSFSYVDNQQALARAGILAEQDMPAGEVYISVERAAAQGAELGVPRDEELVRLLVHGLFVVTFFIATRLRRRRPRRLSLHTTTASSQQLALA